MKTFNLLFVSISLLCLLVGCTSARIPSTGRIVIDTLLVDDIQIRAIDVKGSELWYAGSKSKMGTIDLATKKYMQFQIDNSNSEFRSIARSGNNIFVLNAGSPAKLYRVSSNGKSIEQVYSEKHEKVFYDSMAFWNEQEGIAIGDPTAECMSIIITRNGGKTWRKIPCDRLPSVIPGEAAFAASNSNISIAGNHTWVVTGGIRSRIFHSPDKGNTWEVSDSPIIEGKEMTGIFTSHFYNKKVGLIAGGNYEQQTNNSGNKAITNTGGKSWRLISESSGFGYASSVRFVPGSGGKSIVSVGGTGLWRSDNGGESWTKLSDDISLYTISFVDRETAIAAGRNKIIRIKFR